jgi:ubiquinone biosynthesis accessory factor UbiJ
LCRGPAYNPRMQNPLFSLLGSATMARATLLLNHVLSSETVATERLKPHAGRTLQLQWTGWPAFLPAAPVVAFTVTPAGLLEGCFDTPPEAPELRVLIDASNPLRLATQWLGGERPSVGIEGDAAFATDVNWLIANLRWDIEDDLAKVVGPSVARPLAQFGALVGRGFVAAVQALSGLVSRGSAPADGGPR